MTASSGPGPHYRGSRSHAFRHATLGTTPLDKWSAWRRDLYMTTHDSHKRHPWPGGIRTRNSSKRAAADQHLLPRDHWDRSNCFTSITNIRYQTWFANAIRKPVTTQNWRLFQLLYIMYRQYFITEQTGRRYISQEKRNGPQTKGWEKWQTRYFTGNLKLRKRGTVQMVYVASR
jgi:hypothetical protein